MSAAAAAERKPGREARREGADEALSALAGRPVRRRADALPAPRDAAALGAAAAERDAAVTLRFVGKREGQTLNALYRGKEYATNVLTFVYDDDAPRSQATSCCARRSCRGEAQAQGKTLRATARTSSSTACCTCRATTTTRDARRARMEARERLALLARASALSATRYAVAPHARLSARAMNDERATSRSSRRCSSACPRS